MAINDKPALINEAISRVINNAPVSEVLRVYSLALQAELERMEDEEILSSLENAGYSDLIEKYTSQVDAKEAVEE